MYSKCLSHLKGACHIEREVSPWFTRQEDTQFAWPWSKSYAFTPCDKNTRKVMIMCQSLYAVRSIQLYNDPAQFEIIEQLDTHAAAKRHAVDILYNRARDAGIHRFWKLGKGKGPPVTFTLPKNKMQEENREFKARILFSYYTPTGTMVDWLVVA